MVRFFQLLGFLGLCDVVELGLGLGGSETVISPIGFNAEPAILLEASVLDQETVSLE